VSASADRPGWRTLLWAAWSTAWMVTEVGHSTPGQVNKESLPGFVAWILVTVVLLATAGQESYMRRAYRLEDKKGEGDK